MSERPVEDEIMDEARKFGHSMAHLMRQHAQARGWWEQRKVRREISLVMRQQRRAEQAERAHHLSYTSQMIHRYQIAAQARTERSFDPRVGAEQQRRDAEADARHLDELRERIVANTRLTQVERGIALDCLETARMWPHGKVKTPELLARAPKVRGLDALRYRARLARESAWIEQRRRERETSRKAPQPTSQRAEAVQHARPATPARTGWEPDWMPVLVENGRVSEPSARQDPAFAEMASLKQRHHLSIEHNADLAERNSALTRQLTAMAAERDQYRQERDEAVQKLVGRTPAQDRLGSPERIAEELKNQNTQATTHNAFAGLSTNAFAAGREKNGMHR
ncbi:hypothetical protein [Nocardia sp. NPDC002869]|uniref:hypothetical protein n=1 Tax=Nocardia sp. NPDC002869 TaxID=3161032 RepID=UPI00398CFE74